MQNAAVEPVEVVVYVAGEQLIVQCLDGPGVKFSTGEGISLPGVGGSVGRYLAIPIAAIQKRQEEADVVRRGAQS